jgi:hypothetical protein
MNLVALTDRPAAPHFPQWVRLDLECERVNFGHPDIMRQRRLARQTNIPEPQPSWHNTHCRFCGFILSGNDSIANFRYQWGKIRELYRNSEICQRLGKVEGIGPMTARALIAAVGDRSSFKNGRQFAAWLGLVPKQRSSGGRARLFGISKRGDRYLRTLLIHGARAALGGFETSRIPEACG